MSEWDLDDKLHGKGFVGSRGPFGDGIPHPQEPEIDFPDTDREPGGAPPPGPDDGPDNDGGGDPPDQPEPDDGGGGPIPDPDNDQQPEPDGPDPDQPDRPPDQPPEQDDGRFRSVSSLLRGANADDLRTLDAIADVLQRWGLVDTLVRSAGSFVRTRGPRSVAALVWQLGKTGSAVARARRAMSSATQAIVRSRIRQLIDLRIIELEVSGDRSRVQQWQRIRSAF